MSNLGYLIVAIIGGAVLLMSYSEKRRSASNAWTSTEAIVVGLALLAYGLYNFDGKKVAECLYQ